MNEVGTITPACGVRPQRVRKRFHTRVVTQIEQSVMIDVIRPDVGAERLNAA